ncbi:uncharacterized protein LOC121961516 [Plectropomus leopardus]|uniref:uncharacterized protein LOC121961516 n=1 Tax=Plectropomus leopardus TaxID=160734 RepID=UPI001C4B0901|nr:uncharacterized protein LOC121961516 [Plectropomus leopardus]
MSSGSTCAVSGCYNNTKKVKDFLETSCCLFHYKLRRDCMCPAPYRLHSMPRNQERRAAWLKALRLKRPPKRVYVCSFHFVERIPTKLHPDPELYLGHDQSPSSEAEKKLSKMRQGPGKRKPLIQPETQPPATPGCNFETQPATSSCNFETQLETSSCNFETQLETSSCNFETNPATSSYNFQTQPTIYSNDVDGKQEVEGGPDCSVDFTMTVADYVDISTSSLSPDPLCDSVQTQLEDPVLHDHDYYTTPVGKDVHDKTTQCDEFGYLMLQNDSDALLYTGIALETFNVLVSTLEGFARNAFPLSLRDQVLMTLMKLKNNCEMEYLSRQFCVSESTASRIVSYCVDKLDQVLRPLIPWLPKEIIQAIMPKAFKNFPNTTCILEFSESRLQKRKDLKSCKTVKYQVALAPCGIIMFISATYGRLCSDTLITEESGILDLLKPGDEVMTLHDFTVKDLLLEREVNLVVPSFEMQRRGLPEEQVKTIIQMAHHCERAIGRLEDYTILSQVVPNTMAPKIDKILRICAGLVNLRVDLARDWY